MARRRQDWEETVSLFPFLSVLLCAMGTLIVVISGNHVLAVGNVFGLTSDDEIVDLSGAAQDREVILVECDAEGLLIHGHGDAPTERVPLAAIRGIRADARLAALAGPLRADARRHFVLLVRPVGVASFHNCRAFLKSHADASGQKVSLGKVAILATDRIRFIRPNRPVIVTRKKASS